MTTIRVVERSRSQSALEGAEDRYEYQWWAVVGSASLSLG
jgi:hypothetical protein